MRISLPWAISRSRTADQFVKPSARLQFNGPGLGYLRFDTRSVLRDEQLAGIYRLSFDDRASDDCARLADTIEDLMAHIEVAEIV